MFSTIPNAGLFLLAAPPSGGAEGGSSMVQTFVFMGLIFVVFWFFMIRPQKQKQKRRDAMLKSIEKGDCIVTTGGIRGTVAKVSDDVITVKVDDNCKINFGRSAISEVILDEQETARRVEASKADNSKADNSKAAKQNDAEKNEKQENEKQE